MTAATTFDRIDYARPFAERIGGRIYARFRLGPDGQPSFKIIDDLQHFTIDCYLHSPRASEIYEVQYVMKDPTFYDPVGFSAEATDDFHEVVESYGEVPVEVRVLLGGSVYTQQTRLSAMLENGHAQDMTPAIEDAIQRIKST